MEIARGTPHGRDREKWGSGGGDRGGRGGGFGGVLYKGFDAVGQRPSPGDETGLVCITNCDPGLAMLMLMLMDNDLDWLTSMLMSSGSPILSHGSCTLATGKVA